MCSQKNLKVHIFTHFANEIAAICMELSNRSHSKNVQSQKLQLSVTVFKANF